MEVQKPATHTKSIIKSLIGRLKQQESRVIFTPRGNIMTQLYRVILWFEVSGHYKGYTALFSTQLCFYFRC